MAEWLRKSEGTEGGREDEQMKRHGGAAISERGNSDRRKIASKRSRGNSQGSSSPSLSSPPPPLLTSFTISPPPALIHTSRHTKFNIVYSFFPSRLAAQLRHYREAWNDLQCVGMGLFVHILSLLSTSPNICHTAFSPTNKHSNQEWNI